MTSAILATASDTEFSEDNDPWGSRDFGTVTVQGEKPYWKIDYYDAGDDPARTHAPDRPICRGFQARVTFEEPSGLIPWQF